MEWSPQMESDLIEEVRKYKFLYDPKDPLYYKKTLRAITYNKIAEHMAQEHPNFGVQWTHGKLIVLSKNFKGIFSFIFMRIYIVII